jgi:hypothetical protein
MEFVKSENRKTCNYTWEFHKHIHKMSKRGLRMNDAYIGAYNSAFETLQEVNGR